MGQSKKKSSESSCAAWAVLLLVITALTVVATPVILVAKKKSEITTTTSNAKQLFLTLVEFDLDYGSFPGDSTAVLHENERGSDKAVDLRGYKGEFSNDYLGQLLAVGFEGNKEPFQTPGKRSGLINGITRVSISKALGAGECGFSYVKNQSTNDDTGRPLLLAPMTGEGVTFDRAPYDDKAVVLRIDGAAKQFRINKDGLANVGKGKTLFESGPDTVWGEDGFDPSMLVHPKPQQWIDGRGPSWTARILLALLMIGLVRLFLRRRPQRPQENA